MLPDRATASPAVSRPSLPLTAMNVRSSVGLVVRRRLERAPVYAPAAPARFTPTQKRGRPLSDFHEDIVRSQVEGAGGDERQLLHALDRLDFFINSGRYPSQSVFTFLLHDMMGVELLEVRRRCLLLLRQIAFLHPPRCKRTPSLYYDALRAGAGSEFWELLSQSVKRCVEHRPADSEYLVHTEFLDFLLELLEEDVTAWNFRLRREPVRLRFWRQTDWPLVAHITSSAKKHLCCWLVKAYADGVDKTDVTTRLLLLRLVAMVAEMVRMMGQDNVLDVTDDMKALAMDLCREIVDAALEPLAVEALLCSLRPAWLAAWTSASLLERWHCLSRPRLLTLQTLADVYLTRRTPLRSTENGRPDDGWQAKVAAELKSGVSPAAKAMVRRSVPSPSGSPSGKRRKVVVNKVDGEATPLGRTPLRLVCARGDVPLLEACLRQPDAHVNAPDSAGRTPLRHAAAASSTDCLRPLLEHRPCDQSRDFSPTESRRAASAPAGVASAAAAAPMHGRGKGSPPPPLLAADIEQYSLLVYHLLAGHLLHSGLTEARVELNEQLARRAAPHRRLPDRHQLSDQLVVAYCRELRSLQEQLWQGRDLSWLHSDFRRFMRAATKL